MQEELKEDIVYISGTLNIHFDGEDTFTVYDTTLVVDTFWYSDIISMQHAKDVAERYAKRLSEGYII